MKIECAKTKLYNSVVKADKITGKNATLPVLSCIILEAKESNLVIRSTNLDLGIEIKLPVKVLKEGIVAVPSSIFVSYISNLSDNESVTLEADNGNLLVTSSKNETNIKALSHEDFPTIPQIKSDKSCTISSTGLLHGLRSVWYSAAVSSMKPELSSVYIYPEAGSLVFVATDSFRLAEKSVAMKQSETFESVLIPYRNVGEIIRIFDDYDGEIKLDFDNNQLAFVSDGIYLVSRIIDGNFPDYKQIIPKDNTTEVILLKQDLGQALKLSNIFSDRFNQVSFTIKPNDSIFEIASKNVDKGENRNVVEATLRGDAVDISFNHKYITDAFSSIDSDSLTLNFHGKDKPMIIKGVNDGTFMYLVMPMNK
jgi:DNA polymerase-3 subunit beta